MHKISPKLPLSTCFFLPKVAWMNLGASQQCVINLCKNFKKKKIRASQAFKPFQTHMLTLLLTRFYVFLMLPKLVFHGWGFFSLLFNPKRLQNWVFWTKKY